MNDELPPGVDVLVVGAGVVGLAHAVRALDSGLRVVVIDRDHCPTGASVRNFGHVGSTLQSGELGELAVRARESWLRLDARGAVAVQQTGTVVVAENDLELAVLEDLAGARPDEVRMVTPAQVASITGVPDRAGAFFPLDLRVNPRTAIPGLAAWVGEQPTASVHWVTAYLGRNDDGSVRTTRGSVHADRVIVAVGHDLDTLEPEAAGNYQIQRCRLQMARVDAGLDRVEPAVLTATSMLRYSAFPQAPSYDAFATEARTRLHNLVGIDANVMMTQMPDGTLLVGDSHDTSDDAPPFLTEQVSTTLLQTVGDLLQRPVRVLERWQGVYATSPLGPYLVRETTPGTTVVTVTTGLGMTIAHAVASLTFP